jgi:hypothetical protein
MWMLIRFRFFKQESSFSEEKEAKRLLLFWLGVGCASETNWQKSFASFLQKRRPCFFITSSPLA